MSSCLSSPSAILTPPYPPPKQNLPASQPTAVLAGTGVRYALAQGRGRNERQEPSDLILLDIGLPGVSGLQAARQIRKVSAESRIIFLSQHDSLQMVREALKTGTYGYVTKFDTALELLDAIRAVRDGSYFVSQQIVNQGWVLETI
jgi:DNA-binding NarL/FixJ family response regulator